MKKSLLTAGIAFLLCGYASAFKVTVTPLGGKPVSDDRQKVTVSKADIIVDEDFSGFAVGVADDVHEWSGPLCGRYSSELIDPSLTHGAQWTGHSVYQAGGCAGLWTINPQDPAYINTPKMDYSGTIKVSFLCKALLTENVHLKSTTMMVGMGTDDYGRGFDFEGDGKEEIKNFDVFPIYPNQGWCEVNIEFDNYSAYNDAYLHIASTDHLLVDDIRITASVDKFIGSPVFKGFTAATDDSFTISFEPVRKAYNYYTYLYELDGYDAEGNPVYKTVVDLEDIFSPEELAQIEAMGMTLEEYLEEMAKQMGMTYDELIGELVYDKPYNNIGTVDHKDSTKLYTYTYKNLDPEKQYYFDIRSHYYTTFSPENIRPVEVVGTPKNLEATGIGETGFTANWSGIAKAEGYAVDLYGVNIVEEDEESFVIFEEDFDATADLTDATDIANPEATGEGSDITFDDLTSTPGWKFGNDDYILLVKGKAGLGVADDRCFRLTSPTIYTAGAETAVISISVESTVEDYELRIRFADVAYSLPVKGSRFEGEFEVPTLGMRETTFSIAGPDEAPIFIDWFSVSQPLKKGAKTFTWLGREEFGMETLSHAYSGLDPEWFGAYAFSANAWIGEGGKRLTSFDGERMIVDLKNGTSTPQWAAADEIQAAEAVETARYTLDGRRIDAPVKGINIVRYSDGSVRKVMVK